MSGSAPQLKEACQDMVSMLERFSTTLDQLANKLEQEFSERFGPHEVNPMVLSQRIRRLERELPPLKQQCQAVMSGKQECLDEARRLNTHNTDQLHHLSATSGFRPPDSEAVYAAFCKATAEWEAQMTAAGMNQQEYSKHELNLALAKSALDIQQRAP